MTEIQLPASLALLSQRYVCPGVESFQQNLEQACAVWGDQTRRLEPPIKMGARYSDDPSKPCYLSQACHKKLQPDEKLVLDDNWEEIYKSVLWEFKNDARPKEG